MVDVHSSGPDIDKCTSIFNMYVNEDHMTDLLMISSG